MGEIRQGIERMLEKRRNQCIIHFQENNFSRYCVNEKWSMRKSADEIKEGHKEQSQFTTYPHLCYQEEIVDSSNYIMINP